MDPAHVLTMEILQSHFKNNPLRHVPKEGDDAFFYVVGRCQAQNGKLFHKPHSHKMTQILDIDGVFGEFPGIVQISLNYGRLPIFVRLTG